MAEVIELFKLLVPFFDSYGIVISLFGGLLFGVETIMILAFLGSNSKLSYIILFIFGLAGLILSDSIWFSIGKYKIISKLGKVDIFKRILDKSREKLEIVVHRNLFITLLYSKFVYGISIATLIYLGFKNVEWKNFLMANTIVNIIGISIAIILGWLAANGFKFLLNTFRDIKIAAIFVLIFLILLWILNKIINHEIIKWSREK